MTKTYNWGILGTGWIARKMADALPFVPNAKLYAVASRNNTTAQSFATEYHIEKAYGSYEDLVKDPAIDVVYIATPHNLHYSNTLLALEYGKNVLCEKPFAVNGRQVRGMMAKAKEKDVFLMEAMWTRFLPQVIKAKEIIDSGQIGKVKLLDADFGLGLPFDPKHRLFNKELIGGSLLDLGIYPLFLALFLLGKPKTMKALAGMGITDVDYNCSFTLGYEGECMAALYSSCVAQTDVVASVYGEKGKIVFDKWWFTPVPIHLFNAEGKEMPLKFDFVGNGYNYEAAEVVKCLAQGKKQSDLMSWEDSLQLIDMLDAIRKEIGLTYPGHD